MIKIFISCPMSGLADEQIKRNIAKAKTICEKIANAGLGEHQYLDSFIEDKTLLPFGKHIAVAYLSASIELLSNSDLVVFVPGWEKARGCRIEHQIAKEYCIPIFEIPSFMWEAATGEPTYTL